MVALYFIRIGRCNEIWSIAFQKTNHHEDVQSVVFFILPMFMSDIVGRARREGEKAR
jgi:hypothetical protein